jgi:hypothetical protein
MAKLKFTPERKNIFITADILSGSPQKGDNVLQGNVPAMGAATAPAATTAPANPATPTVSISPGAMAAPPPVTPAEFLRPVPTNP